MLFLLLLGIGATATGLTSRDDRDEEDHPSYGGRGGGRGGPKPGDEGSALWAAEGRQHNAKVQAYWRNRDAERPPAPARPQEREPDNDREP